MTASELALLKASIDQVVEIETAQRGPHYAQILFVFDEGDTPDVFYLEMERGPAGELKPKSKAGLSVLLADVLAVHPEPPPSPPSH